MIVLQPDLLHALIHVRFSLLIGKPEQQPSKWGLSEAELFLSKGAPTEGMGLGGEAMEAGSDKVIQRRLIIGLGISALAVGLANVPS